MRKLNIEDQVAEWQRNLCAKINNMHLSLPHTTACHITAHR